MSRKFEGIWIPRQIWMSKDLTLQEKIFLVEINSLDNEEGCWASNKYFSEFFGLSKRRVREIISSLTEKKHLTLELTYKENTKEVDKRILRVCSALYGNVLVGEEEKHPTPREENGHTNEEESCPTTGEESCHYSSTSSINTSFNNNYIVEIIDHLNQVCHTNYKSTTKKTKQLIEARFKEGFTVEDFKMVINNMHTKWNGTEWQQYLRPSTLFNGEKFEGYLNMKVTDKTTIEGRGLETAPKLPF